MSFMTHHCPQRHAFHSETLRKDSREVLPSSTQSKSSISPEPGPSFTLFSNDFVKK